MLRNRMGGRQLIDVLARRQRADHLSDKEFACVLGLRRDTWVHYRQGRRGAGYALVLAVAQRLPEYAPELLQFLRNGGG